MDFVNSRNNSGKDVKTSKETFIDRMAEGTAASITRDKKGLVGIKGWLKFFIIRFYIFGTGFLIGAIINIIDLNITEAIAGIILSPISLYAGYALDKKKKGCVLTARIASITTFGIVSFFYFIVSQRVKNTYKEKKYLELAVSFP